MTRFSRKCLFASLAGLAFVAVSCNEPEKKSASPGELPTGRMDEAPRINAATYFAHAHLLERQGAFDRAVEQYRKAIELQPDFPTARNRLGITLNKLSRHAEATVEFQQAILQKPNQSYLYNNLGFSQYLEGNYVQAEQSFIQAVTLQPGFARANMNLGLTLGRQGRFDEAYAAFRHASDDVTAYYNLAVVQSESGAYTDAVRSLDAALRINPQYQPAVAYLRDISQLAAEQEQVEQQRLAQLAASAPLSAATDSRQISQDSVSTDDEASSAGGTVEEIDSDTSIGANASTNSAAQNMTGEENSVERSSDTAIRYEGSAGSSDQHVSVAPGQERTVVGGNGSADAAPNESINTYATEQQSNASTALVESPEAFAPHYVEYDPECDENGNEITTSWAGGAFDSEYLIESGLVWPDGAHGSTAVAGAVAERNLDGQPRSFEVEDFAVSEDIDAMLAGGERNFTRAQLAAELSETMEAALQGRCAWAEVWCLLESAAAAQDAPRLSQP